MSLSLINFIIYIEIIYERSETMSDKVIPNQAPFCPGGLIYTVRAGDTFYSIAKIYRIDVYAIMKANPNVDPNNLQISQRICVPAGPPLCPGGLVYTIRAGDTFHALAKVYRIDVYAIMKANPNVDPRNLQIGQQICIPGAGHPGP